MKIIQQSAHILKEWPNMNLYERCEFAGRISHASEDKIKEGSAEEFVRRMVKLGHESVFEFARIEWGGKYPPGEDFLSLSNLRGVRFCARNHFEFNQVGEIGNGLREIAKEYPAFFSDFPRHHPIWKPVSGFLPAWGIADDWIPVLITTNRAISHQLVRYRKDVVYLQQSQRYVKFHDDIDFIDPSIYFPDNLGELYDNPEYEGGRLIKNHAMEVWETAMESAEQDYIWFLSEGYSAQAARLVLPNSAATKLIMYASPDTWRHVFEQRISNKADPMIRELLEPLKEEFVKEGLL